MMVNITTNNTKYSLKSNFEVLASAHGEILINKTLNNKVLDDIDIAVAPDYQNMSLIIKKNPYYYLYEICISMSQSDSLIIRAQKFIRYVSQNEIKLRTIKYQSIIYEE